MDLGSQHSRHAIHVLALFPEVTGPSVFRQLMPTLASKYAVGVMVEMEKFSDLYFLVEPREQEEQQSDANDTTPPNGPIQ